MKKNILPFLSTILCLIFSLHSKANLLPVSDSTLPLSVKLFPTSIAQLTGSFQSSQSQEKIENELRKFSFSVALTPRFKTTIPPINLYFEHGIAGLASLGVSLGVLYDREPALDYQAATVSAGVRACGYPLPIISKISGNEINNYGFQPYMGLLYDYYATAVSIADEDIDPYRTSKFGLCAGTRWYPGKGKFALMGEYNSNGLGSDIRVGITLGR